MNCTKCGAKAQSQGQVDEHWYFYKCRKCGYEWARVKGERLAPRREVPQAIKGGRP